VHISQFWSPFKINSIELGTCEKLNKPEIIFDPSRVTKLDKNSPQFFLSVVGSGNSDVTLAYVLLYFLVNMPNGAYIKQVVYTTLTEAVAGTLVSKTLTNSDLGFGRDELEAGVYPLGADAWLNPFTTGSAINTAISRRVQFSKSAMSSSVYFANTDLLGEKILLGHTGNANVGEISFIDTYKWPTGG
jgi:hypothetical protein